MINNHIQVHVPFRPGDPELQYEYLWAEPLGGNHARLINIPLALDYGLWDVVEFDPDQDNLVIDVVTKGSQTYGGTLDEGDTEQASALKQLLIKNFVARYGVQISWVTPTLCAMAAPVNMADDAFDRMMGQCPVDLKIFSAREPS